jgi:hypothetical protein
MGRASVPDREEEEGDPPGTRRLPLSRRKRTVRRGGLMSKAGNNRGRDGQPIPTVDVSTEHLEVERRRVHERSARTVQEALEEAAPKLERKGWKVTKRG